MFLFFPIFTTNFFPPRHTWQDLRNFVTHAAIEVVPSNLKFKDNYTSKIRVDRMGALCRCSQQKTCNISETGQDRNKITIGDQLKVHTRFQLVLKSTTLDDLEGPLCTLFQNTCELMFCKVSPTAFVHSM